MKRIALTIAALLAGILTTTASPAAAYSQVCVATPETLIHTPFVLGDGEDETWLGGLIVRPFPNSAVGCSAYDGVPLEEWESLYPGERTYYDSAATYAAEPAAPYVAPTWDQPTASEPVKAAHRCGKAHRKHRHYKRNCR